MLEEQAGNFVKQQQLARASRWGFGGSKENVVVVPGGAGCAMKGWGSSLSFLDRGQLWWDDSELTKEAAISRYERKVRGLG